VIAIIRNKVDSFPIRNIYILNISFVFVWWILLNPGFYSADSIAVLNRVASGNLISEWTYLWDVFVYVTTLGGVFPQLATLAGGLILVSSFTFFCLSFFDRKVACLTSVFVSNLPIVFGLGLTLWHDVTMTSGLLLFAALIKNTHEKKRVNKVIYLLSFLLVNTRLNGFWTLLFCIVTIAMLKRIRVNHFIGLTAFLILVTAPLSYLNTIHASNENAQVAGLTHWMKYDISCYLSVDAQARTEVSRSLHEKGMFLIEVTDGRACNWFMNPEELASWSLVPTESIVNIWLRLFRSDVASVFEIHASRSEYLVFNPFRVPAKPPFLHTNIEYENPWVQEWNPDVYQFARIFPRAWNFIGSITAYAGFWWFVILISLLRNSKYFSIFVMSTILNASVFVTAIIPDARYVAFTLITGITLMTAAFFKFVLSRSS